MKFRFHLSGYTKFRPLNLAMISEHLVKLDNF